MAYVTMYMEIDTDQALDKMSVQEIEDYLKIRKAHDSGEDVASKISRIEAEQTLNDLAFDLRKNGSFATAYRLDEIKYDFIH